MLLLKNKIRNSLRHRLLFWVWLTSSIATFIFTTIQLVSEYKARKNFTLSQVQTIEKNILPSINKSTWDYNYEYLNLQLQSIMNMDFVSQIHFQSIDKEIFLNNKYKVKEKISTSTKNNGHKIFELPLKYNGRELGKLEVAFNIHEIKQIYINKALKTFFIQALKTFIVCIILLSVFNKVILTHINNISQYLSRDIISNPEKISLNRSPGVKDEFTNLEDSINSMREKLIDYKKQIEIYNQSLEEQIEKRTMERDAEREKAIHASKLASLGEMAGGIAHEINNPLAIISSKVQTLVKAKSKDKLSDELFHKTTEEIGVTIKRITKIIKGLRIVSRDSSEEPAEVFPVEYVLEDVLQLCAERFNNHGIPLDLEYIDDCQNAKIFANRVQISQVILNLLNNSFDAIESMDEKWVKIQVEQIEEVVSINVIDSGNGIPQEIREKIFSPFFTSKPIGKGTGLGLSISKSIIEKNNGTLALKDIRSKNTCIEMRLKCA